jgi:hypothetical protein
LRLEMELTLVWVMIAVLLVSIIGLVGAAWSAQRDGAESTAQPGRSRVVQLRRSQRPEEPPLAA